MNPGKISWLRPGRLCSQHTDHSRNNPAHMWEEESFKDIHIISLKKFESSSLPKWVVFHWPAAEKASRNAFLAPFQQNFLSTSAPTRTKTKELSH